MPLPMNEEEATPITTPTIREAVKWKWSASGMIPTAGKLNTGRLNAGKLNTARLNAGKLNTAKLNAGKLNTANMAVDMSTPVTGKDMIAAIPLRGNVAKEDTIIIVNRHCGCLESFCNVNSD
ncbi:MAG: hypothetical protein JWM59_2864 [Verrucomicrobiales bacterium]|nr:hypothetical protein [Verrucomicrobiales bacterium]